MKTDLHSYKAHLAQMKNEVIAGSNFIICRCYIVDLVYQS